MNPFEKLLQTTSGSILLDGAMGTMLMEAGLEEGAAPEKWNLTHPDRVKEVHRLYIQAGSRLILTNSFGGTRYRLEMRGLEDEVIQINKAAAEIARAEADAAPHLVAVAGSMGPTGKIFTPMGDLTYEEAKEAFAEQASGLAQGGVDVFWIETMSAVEEVEAAVAGIRSISDLPISATMSFDTHGHTMMGVTPEKAVESLSQMDLASLGANCGTGSEELQEVIRKMKAANPPLPLVAKANAGIPRVVEGNVEYSGSPAVMAEYAREVRKLGARLIGACCGSTPEHIKAMAKALDLIEP
ncbi:MAG: betaine--homocysteine S-methyltransferase [Anaerolineales bacterium]